MQDRETKFRWPVAVERSIDATSAEVWRAISTPGNLESCHPFCRRNPVHVWDGAKSHDEVHYLSGWVYERRFHQWYEGTGYDLEIISRGKAIASVQWRISATDGDSCKLRITVYPYLLQGWPLLLRWFPHAFWLRPILSGYLRSVVSGFEWFVTRGERVPRNQFGRHPWFSAE